MATPELFDDVIKFTHKIPPFKGMFLPLMQNNDDFIISAIVSGLVKKVIWIMPTWLKSSRYVSFSKSYIGWIHRQDNNSKTFCQCDQQVRKRKITSIQCYYLDRNKAKSDNVNGTDNGDEFSTIVKTENCHKLKEFTYIALNEKNFGKYINLKQVNKLIVDIDEDFFGVESGIQAFLDRGLSEITQGWCNDFIATLTCPLTVSDEKNAEEILRTMFKAVYEAKINNLNEKLIKSLISNPLHSLKTLYPCKEYVEPAESTHYILETFTEFIYNCSLKELKALSILKYCLTSSPVLKRKPHFSLCTGNIAIGDSLNQIHLTSDDEINENGHKIKNLLKMILSKIPIKFVSIARSLRDGYTPRKYQRLIEKVLMRSLEQAFGSFEKKPKVKYDRHLAFGKDGWI